MTNFRWWQKALPVLIASFALAACGGAPVPGPGTAAPTPTVVPVPSPPSTPAPTETCASFLPTAPCGTYASVSGKADGKDLPWASSRSVTAKLQSVGGSFQLTVTTTCGPLSGPATRTGTVLTVGDIAVGASACAELAASQQQWVLAFLKKPIDMAYNNGTLTWTSGTDSLAFKPK